MGTSYCSDKSKERGSKKGEGEAVELAIELQCKADRKRSERQGSTSYGGGVWHPQDERLHDSIVERFDKEP